MTMFPLSGINRSINRQRMLRLLSSIALIATLILSPVLFNDQPIAEIPGFSLSANAQTTQQPETAQSESSPASDEGNAAASEAEEEKEINFFAMAMGALAGLVLFIFGVTRLSEGLEDLGTERMRSLLSKFTTNRFAGVATGVVATTLLESSSVTIIMVIAMVSAGVLTFVQSLGVVLGSNIGMAVGAQIISLGIAEYVPLLMFAGLLLLFLGRSARQKTIGIIILGFGLMFYGLEAIDEAMKPFRDYEPFINWMERLGTTPYWEQWWGHCSAPLFSLPLPRLRS